MAFSIRSNLVRYPLAIGIFAVLILVPFLMREALGFSFDTTFLIIVAMIACAWYLGRGPAIVVALLFEVTLSYFSPAPSPSRAAIITLNRLVLFFGVVFFASARRTAERRLREQQEVLEVTLSSIGDAVIATDVDGKISFLNSTAEELTGWSFFEAKNKPIHEIFKIINEIDRDLQVKDPFTLVTERGGVVGLANHTLLIRKDGREIPIDDSGAPIRDNNGDLIGVIIVFHDVTERRTAERERELLLSRETKARSDAETANRLKDDFLSTVSHELRTPLNAIVGWTGLLRSKTLSDDAAIQNALAVIERNARAQNRLIDDILDVSRIVSGKLALDLAPVRLADVVESAVESLKPEAAAKNTEIETRLFASPVVSGDRVRLLQIFANLLSNAVKFTPGSGKISVRLTVDQDETVVSVSDSGVGIASEDVAHIFDRFRQLDSSTRRSQGGLGLGLAIVKNLTEMHGGKVSAQSDGPGRGATFTIQLPVINATVAGSDNSRALERPQLSGLKILVVDDNADSLDICRVGLEQFGAITRGADSCAAAVPIFTSWRPDVLVSDLGMPGEDGFDLIGKIRSLPVSGGGRTPAAAVTAYARKEDREKALAAGYQLHVAKPVDVHQLANELLSLIQKDRHSGNGKGD
jgi:PAS domain S-box-containing protein